jgi:hypothetical protein
MTAYITELILSDRTDHLAIGNAVREQLEDDTETFLYALYDAVSVRLAASFRTLSEHAKRELKALRDIARSLDVLETESAPPTTNAAVDRIVWRQVARSSILALFDWLITQPGGLSVPAETWTRGTCAATLDFETFRRETSLAGDDAKLAVNVSAQTIIESGLLDAPRPLWYRGRYLTALASAGHLWSTTTDSPPIVWVPLTGKERPVLSQTGDTVSIRMPEATEVDLVRLTPWIGVEQTANRLIVGPTVRSAQDQFRREQDQSAPVVNGVAVRIDDRCRSVMTSGRIRIACNAPGALSFSAPSRAVTSHEHGLLLEWNVVKDVG